MMMRKFLRQILTIAISAALMLTLAACSEPTDPGSEGTPTNTTATKRSEANKMTGEITIKLFPELAPVAVATFIKAAEDGYYSGKIFHRIIEDFMIQGGSPNGDGIGSAPEYEQYDTEPSPHAKHLYGALSTANTGMPKSNGQQFFIVSTQHTDWLDGKHTVFGHTVDGFDLLDTLGVIKTSNHRPVNQVTIESVTINTFSGGDDPTENSIKGNVGGDVKLENGDKYAVITISYTPD